MAVVKITPDKVLEDAAERLRKHPSLDEVIVLSRQEGKIYGYDGNLSRESAIEYIKLLAKQVDIKLLETIEHELHFLRPWKS